jgi:uncharacterized protein (DUF1330 family)
MPAHIVATVSISDAAAFGRYARGIEGLAEAHGGEYLVRGVVSASLEGDVAPGEWVVVLRFPDGAAARGFIDSAEYQTAKRHRLGAATLAMRLIEA